MNREETIGKLKPNVKFPSAVENIEIMQQEVVKEVARQFTEIARQLKVNLKLSPVVEKKKKK